MSWQCLVFPLAVALLTGGIAILRKTATSWRMTRVAQGWPTTTGRIMRSEVVKEDVGRTYSYTPFISYEYSTGGYTYQSEHYSFIPHLSSDERVAVAKCAKYTEGQSVTVYYNPAKPSEAAIETRIISFDLYLLWGLLGVALLIPGALLLLITLVSLF